MDFNGYDDTVGDYVNDSDWTIESDPVTDDKLTELRNKILGSD